ncbi:MAG: GNAT family N-acetyltransferase [Chitinophagales bacterium]|nr:GNAT family N-acetyltransferase [Chitinophagaceae bacterium]MCB9065579.1 GNAT family N-acetyltransferase [Chitinophagales bacterium]
MDNKALYRQFCAEEKDMPLFIKDWWLDAVCCDWDVVLVKKGDRIAGAWPYKVEKKMNVTLLRDQVLTPYWGPYVAYPHDLKHSKRDNFQHETITALLEQLPKVQYMYVSLFPGLKQVGLFKDNGLEVNTRQTFIMPLEERIDNVFDKLHEDYRRNVRKAEAELEIEDEPALLKDLWEYQKATLDGKDVRMHFSLEQLQSAFDACKQHDCTALWVARKGGEVQAILWHLWDDKHAYYLVGSKNPASKNNRAMTALIWHAITESKLRDKLSFDFEGSMDPGVEKFFRNFGGNRELYLVIQKNTSLLWKLKSLLR